MNEPDQRSIDFGRVSAWYDLYVTASFDIRFWQRIAEEAAGPRLELMCGTGRIMLPLLRAGTEIEGLDYSPEMLAVLRRKLRAGGLKATLHHGDARTFELGRRYGLVFIGFNSISEVLDDADKLRVFERVRAHLAPSGTFWVTAHNPALRRATLDGRTVEIGSVRIPETDEELHVTGRYTLDAATDIVNGDQFYRCERAGSLTRNLRLGVRFHLITPARLEGLVSESGLRVLERLGNYDGSAFVAESSPFVLMRCAAPR